MLPSFDIFRVAKDGRVLWCSAADTLEDAQAQVKILSELGCEFVILNQSTQESTRVRFNDSHGLSSAKPAAMNQPAK